MKRENDPAELVPEEELVAEDDAIIGRAFRFSLLVFGVLGVLGLAVVLWLRRESDRGETRELAVEAPVVVERTERVPAAPFTDVTEASGIRFVHTSGARGEKLLPETMGGGVAFFDRDGDGDQDLLFVNGSEWPEHAADQAAPATLALYDNDGKGGFADVTAEAGLAVGFYGMGAALADYDCDGDRDLFVTAVGRNRFFRNDGGRFEEADAGVAGGEDDWSTCAAFFDADGDGDLDLYVGNYVRWTREIDFQVDFRLTGIGRAYGAPTNFAGTFSSLYRNDGDGGFTDVSAAAGIRVANPATGAPMGKALGVCPIDHDGDGDIDLFVANDTVQNFFFENRGDGTFDERAADFGLAFDRNGNATGAMGIDGADYRNDGSLGFAIGNFANEMTSLYVSQSRPDFFSDEAIGEGIGAPSRLRLSFGIFFFDFDLDGRLDLLQANGHLEDEIEKVQASQSYRQPAQLFWNCGTGARACFAEVDPARTGDLSEPIVGRGSAYADIDGDGDLDVVLTQTGARPVLLRNDLPAGAHWIRLFLVGADCNREALGARVELECEGRKQRRVVMPTKSYLSQVELPLTFGLGASAAPCSVTVTWPDGTRQAFEGLAPDRLHVLRRAG